MPANPWLLAALLLGLLVRVLVVDGLEGVLRRTRIE